MSVQGIPPWDQEAALMEAAHQAFQKLLPPEERFEMRTVGDVITIIDHEGQRVCMHQAEWSRSMATDLARRLNSRPRSAELLSWVSARELL
jgi:hypothetical protein